MMESTIVKVMELEYEIEEDIVCVVNVKTDIMKLIRKDESFTRSVVTRVEVSCGEKLGWFVILNKNSSIQGLAARISKEKLISSLTEHI
ncbi:hypothetical protein KHA80_07410 [Anaerobacillus sp. HL2]|nr:hypothetical protein KHA80_07410 [Anaerobacillus sp. HL2]